MKKHDLTGRTPDRGRFFGHHSRVASAGQFSCTLSRATVPKEQLPEHVHDDGHIILALDAGYLSRAFGSDQQGAGFDLIYNPPGTVHRDCFFAPGGRYVSIEFPRDVAPDLPSPTRLPGPVPLKAVESALGCILRGETGSEMFLEEQLLDLVATIGSGAPQSRPPRWFRRAEELIEASCTEPHVTIAGLAASLELHPVYFARAYRAACGHGPARELQRKRLRAAGAMLSRDIALSEVALSCGFADQSHLCRAMRAMLGVTPGALRAAF